jgi:hypothetical protein
MTSLNVNKTKEMIVDFRKWQREHPPIHIDGTVVERVTSFKFLGIHITDKPNWSTHTDSIVKKAQQRFFDLRRLKKFGSLTNFTDAQSRISCRAVSPPGTATALPTTVRLSRR